MSLTELIKNIRTFVDKGEGQPGDLVAKITKFLEDPELSKDSSKKARDAIGSACHQENNSKDGDSVALTKNRRCKELRSAICASPINEKYKLYTFKPDIKKDIEEEINLFIYKNKRDCKELIADIITRLSAKVLSNDVRNEIRKEIKTACCLEDNSENSDEIAARNKRHEKFRNAIYNSEIIHILNFKTVNISAPIMKPSRSCEQYINSFILGDTDDLTERFEVEISKDINRLSMSHYNEYFEYWRNLEKFINDAEINEEESVIAKYGIVRNSCNQLLKELCEKPLCQLLKETLQTSSDLLNDDKWLSSYFGNYFNQPFSSPSDRAKFLQVIGNTLLGEPEIYCQDYEGRYRFCENPHPETNQESSDNIILQRLVQCPELCKVFAEQLSNLTIDEANQGINCWGIDINAKEDEASEKLLNIETIDFEHANTVSEIRQRAYSFFKELCFVKVNVDEDGESIIKRPFNDIAVKVAAKKRAQTEVQAYEERKEGLLGWVRTWGFYRSLNPLTWVGSFVNACIDSLYKPETPRKPDTMLQDVIAKPEDDIQLNFRKTATEQKAKKQGQALSKEKIDIIEKLEKRIAWLPWTGKDPKVIENKRKCLLELVDKIKKADVTPDKVLETIQEWKAEFDKSSSKSPDDASESAVSETVKNIEATPPVKRLRYGEFFAEGSRSANVIQEIVTQLEESKNRALGGA